LGSVLLLAGCADGATPKPSGPAAPASLKTLQKIVLRQGDLPAGWKPGPYKPDPKAPASQKAFLECMGARNSDSAKVAEAHSQEFAYRSASISSSAASYRVQGAPDADLAVLKSAKFSPCYERTLKDKLVTSLPAGATIESASFKVTPTTPGTPSNVVATGTGTVRVNLKSQRVAVYLSVAYIRGPLLETEVRTTSVGEPVTASLVRTLVASVAARAARK
jgi:hypothetical protein